MENLVNKAVLFDYFSGKVTPLQKKMIENWLAESANRADYYQWLNEWELANLQSTADWQQAFARTASRVNAPFQIIRPDDDEPTEIPHQRPWLLGNWRPWLVAATLVLMLGGWLFRDAIRYQTVRTGYGETRALTLTDGSTITLNANSSVRFARWFGQSARRVYLTGEADFTVRHLPDHQPFVVSTAKGLNVTVLGTEFTVLSRSRKTQVVLRSGKVALTMAQQAGKPPLMMRPGDLVTLGPAGQLAKRQTPHPEAAADWKQHRFTFEQTSLREVAALLEENYGLSVVIETPELASRTVSGSFPARDADEVLKLMAELLQINYSHTNNRVIFSE